MLSHSPTPLCRCAASTRARSWLRIDLLKASYALWFWPVHRSGACVAIVRRLVVWCAASTWSHARTHPPKHTRTRGTRAPPHPLATHAPTQPQAIPKAFREFHYKTTQIANRGRNLKAHIVGGLLIGAGMSISGSCPGMAYVQVGAGYASALMAVLGGITGAWAYATFVHDQLAHVLRTHKGSPPTLHGYFKTSFAPTALAVAVVVMAIIAVAEALFPWNGPTEARLMPAAVYAQRDSWTLVDGPWPAYYGGVTLGLAQLLVLWSMATGLGSTSGACTPALKS